MNRCCEPAGAVVKWERFGELLIARCGGVLTLVCLDRVRREMAQELAREDARAVVVDMRETVLLLTQVDRGKLVAAAPDGPSLPVAVVVSPVYEEMARDYCYEAARRGLVRGPFIGEQAAVAWASACREHWPERPAQRPCSQSSPAARTVHMQAA